MALTKVRLPVADIASISDSNSNVTVEGPGGDVTVDVAGTNIGTFDASGLDLGALTIIAQVLTGRDINLANGTVAVQLHADASEGKLGTTSAHPLAIEANNVAALDIATDGKVTLNVEGTAVGHLVTKAYVDAAAGIAEADIDATTATTGHISIPNNTGNALIINWGVTGSVGNDTSTAVVFDEEFPNSFLVAFANCNRGLGGDGGVNINGGSTTGMTVHNVSDVTTAIFWLAIGY